MKVSYSIFPFFFVAPVVTQAQQQILPIPIKNNDPLNDGIYIRSVTLPQHTTKTEPPITLNNEQNGDDDDDGDGSSNVNDGNHISRNNDNRERLIMYDFKPAYPFYTKETLDEVLLMPRRNVVVDEDDDNGNEERVWIESQNDDGVKEILDSDEAVIDEDVVSEGEDDDVAKQEGEPTSGERVDVNDDASSSDYPVVDETEPSSLDNEQTSESVVTINNEEEEEETEEEADKSLQKSETLNVEEKEEGGAIHSEDRRNDDEPPYPAPLNERNDNYEQSTIYPEDLPTPPTDDTEKMHQPLPTQHLQSTSTESGDDEELEAKTEVVIDDDIISDAPEAGEEVVVTLNKDGGMVEQELQQQEEEGVTISIDPVSEFDIESIANEDGSIDNKDVEGNNEEDLQSDDAPDSSETIVDTQANIEEEEEEDTNAQEKESSQSDSPKVTIQYDSDEDTKQPSSVTSSTTAASNTNNKEANRQFVDGLDEIDKLFESVEVPDELDVGADGSSMQDVLVGQGIKIIWKRVKNISMGVKTKVNGMTESVKNVLLPLQLDNIWKSYDEDDSDEDLTLDSLFDLNNKLKKDDNTDGGMKKPQQQEGGSQSSKSNSEKNKAKKDFPLIKSPKAQKIWKWSIKKWRQAKHILDDLLSLIGADDGDDDDYDNLGLGNLGLDDIQMGNTVGNRAKFGSEVDESFIKARVEEMMKDQQK